MAKENINRDQQINEWTRRLNQARINLEDYGRVAETYNELYSQHPDRYLPVYQIYLMGLITGQRQERTKHKRAALHN